MEIIDTNIILRYLVKDDESLYDEAKNIFKKAEDGKRKLLVKVVVIAECCYVLESFYKKTRDEVAESMEVLLSQKWLKVEDRVALC
ncbi:MAG: PilT protein domain protein [Candidatus Woesebacteria bacterium GW2011_GWB1_41_10]|uniref:PilT protein domain protein n=1 Tax=Candidatus Woesebacteria bacterium GW2011_GWB1_41_10 TaxID=1618577 RepID=A0A0G0XDX0_9BACT|nr:MAG: PilT protein domain protein [Candidatus Woesebacteria bacterium GW2011_GWB1_41_10]